MTHLHPSTQCKCVEWERQLSLNCAKVASVSYVSTPVKSSTTVAHSFLCLVSKVENAALRSTLLLSYCRHLGEHREQVWRNIVILFDI